MSSSYAIVIQTNSLCKPILTLTIASDGSFSIQDRIKKLAIDPLIYHYIRFQLPANRVGIGKTISIDGPIYFSKNKPKLSHHAISGSFHISSASNDHKFKIISGFTASGAPKGLGNQSTRLKQETNDGGPIAGGVFFGLNNMPTDSVRSSTKIVFQEHHIRDQSFPPDKGKKSSMAVLFFHFLKSKNNIEFESTDHEWGRYAHHLYKKPVLMRVVDPGSNHNFLIGIACMSSRSNDTGEYGYRIGGGPGAIDPKTGDCLNTHILLEAPSLGLPPNGICLDYEPDPTTINEPSHK